MDGVSARMGEGGGEGRDRKHGERKRGGELRGMTRRVLCGSATEGWVMGAAGERRTHGIECDEKGARAGWAAGTVCD